jgi:hypothetical protein
MLQFHGDGDLAFFFGSRSVYHAHSTLNRRVLIFLARSVSPSRQMAAFHLRVFGIYATISCESLAALFLFITFAIKKLVKT